MNISRIFHFYFGFILILSTFALGNFQSDVWNYFETSYVSVLDVFDVRVVEKAAEVEDLEGERSWIVDSDILVNLKGELIEGDGFVYIGDGEFEELKLRIGGIERLEGLKIALGGDNVVARAELVFGDEIFEGKAGKEEVTFNNLGLALGENEEFSLRVFLKGSAKSGDRVALWLGTRALKVAEGKDFYFFPSEEGKKVYFSVVGKSK